MTTLFNRLLITILAAVAALAGGVSLLLQVAKTPQRGGNHRPDGVHLITE